MEVAWEPRLQPIAIKQRMADLAILDSGGGTLAVEDPLAEKEALPRLGTSALEMDIALPMPQRPVKEIALLKGKLHVMLLGKVETFQFANWPRASRKSGSPRPRSRWTKSAATATRGKSSSSSASTTPAMPWNRIAIGSCKNEAYLEGPDHKPIQPDSTETTMRSKDAIGVGYVFALPELPRMRSLSTRPLPW